MCEVSWQQGICTACGACNVIQHAAGSWSKPVYLEYFGSQKLLGANYVSQTWPNFDSGLKGGQTWYSCRSDPRYNGRMFVGIFCIIINSWQYSISHYKQNHPTRCPREAVERLCPLFQARRYHVSFKLSYTRESGLVPSRCTQNTLTILR